MAVLAVEVATAVVAEVTSAVAVDSAVVEWHSVANRTARFGATIGVAGATATRQSRTFGRAEFNRRIAAHTAERHDANWHRTGIGGMPTSITIGSLSLSMVSGVA